MRSRGMTAVMMLASLALALAPAAAATAQPARAASACDAAQFVADVTVPDGTYITPGSAFLKTWRLKNVGTCTWSTSYALVFSSGAQLGTTSAVVFPNDVLPGQTVDLSVTLVAPNVSGTYQGFWRLKNASGAVFGIGASYASSFWVTIRVQASTSGQSVVAYDFVSEMCSGQWVYDGGPIPCPKNTSKLQLGYVEKLDSPTMENGLSAGTPGLLTVPQQKYNGLIRGMFPVDDIFRGDHFQATVGCLYGASNCYVTFALEYELGGDFFTLWKWRERYDGLTAPIDVDLTRISNIKNLHLVLSVFASGPSEPDQAVWIAPRIVRSIAAQAPTATPTPAMPPTPGITPTPPAAAGCDRAQFVSDVTIPDGTTLSANKTFTKIWRLKNIGTCTWTPAYTVSFVSGDPMGGVDTALPRTVAPGQSGDFAVNLTAPSLNGSYWGYWELKNASGTLFGLGATHDKPFWVMINVAGVDVPTATPTATRTPTPTPTDSATANWSTYLNTAYGFSFKIPPGATIDGQSDTGGRVYLPFAAGTNLVDKYLDVSVAEGVSPCKNPHSNPNISPTNVVFNGIQFLKETWEEGATSHRGDYTSYSTPKRNACISMTFLLWSVVPEVVETPPPRFDPVAESAVFTTIMSTFAIQ